MTKRLPALLLLTFLSAGSVALAHEHKVLGTVTMAAADHVMMKTTEGKNVTVKVPAATKVTKGKADVKIATVKEGTRIVVTTESDEEPYTAKSIQVAEDAAPSPGKK